MVKYRVFPYRQASKGAKRLATALGGKVLLREGSNYVYEDGDVVINWGDSQCPLTQALNRPEAIRLAANKLATFQKFLASGVSIPRFASSPMGVNWSGMTVVRHKLTGHSGEGIEIVAAGEELPDAPLYVEYVKKQEEYRIHVGRKFDETGDQGGWGAWEESIIAEQRKARRLDVPACDVDWQVRNHANGFVFVREGFSTPESVKQAAIDALRALGLDFGAVDVIWNAQQEKAYVLEINTAPGIEGTTVSDYATFFRRD